MLSKIMFRQVQQTERRNEYLETLIKIEVGTKPGAKKVKSWIRPQIVTLEVHKKGLLLSLQQRRTLALP